MASAALMDEDAISRRENPNWMADVIFGYRGSILWSHGRPFTVRDSAIDDAFNNDGSFRWLGFLKKQFISMHKQTLESWLDSLRKPGVPE